MGIFSGNRKTGNQLWSALRTQTQNSCFQVTLLPTVYIHLALIVAVLGPLDKLYDPYNSAL